jgi:hypothetical protein
MRHHPGERGVFLSCASVSPAAASAVSAGLGAGGGFLVLRGGLRANSDGEKVEVA